MTTALFHPKAIKLAREHLQLPDDLPARHALLKPWLHQLETGELQRTRETQLQGDFINIVFGRILGYTTQTSGDGQTWNIRREENVARHGRKAADAAIGWFEAGHDPLIHAVIELKGAGQSLDAGGSRGLTPVQQAWDYANQSRSCRWIIASNFRETRLYHRGRTPFDMQTFHLTDLAEYEEFVRFWMLFARDRLLPETPESNAPLDQLLADSDRTQLEITNDLYRDYRDVRLGLFQDLRRVQSNLPPLEVLHLTQKLLDRVLFIAFAEDRGLLPPQTVDSALDGDGYVPTWHRLRAVFDWINRGKPEKGFSAFNGGLFAADEELDALEPSDEALKRLLKIARYDFSEDVSVEVLGHIFEQSITDLEELRAQASGEVAEGLSSRKRHGVFYTPAFVTRYLVERTLGRTMQERLGAIMAARRPGDVRGKNKKTAAYVAVWQEYREWLKGVRVVDPACGSGAFLVAAFDRLHMEYERVNRALEELEVGGQRDLFSLSKTILNQNLFGVDLIEESVEITCLSLWLKTAETNRKLTSLDENVVSGDSIVADPDISARAFDWRRGRRVMSTLLEARTESSEDAGPGAWSQGFDVVIGNPPYVRQELLTDIKPHLQANYRSWHGMADLFVYFFERGLQILKPGGRLGFIVANKWMKGGYAEPLRGLLAAETEVEQIIDFGHAPIFPDADAFPSVVVIRKPQVGAPMNSERTVSATVFPREELGDSAIDDFVLEREVRIPQRAFGTAPWSLEPPGVRALIEKMRRVGVRLEDRVGTAPSYGIKTGYNQAYLIDQHVRDQLVDEHAEAASVLRKFLRGRNIDRWYPAWNDEYLILMKSSGDHPWPWRGLPEADAEAAFERTFPSLHRHFKSMESRLRKRTDQGQYWWELRSCAYYDEFERPKIVYQDIIWTGSFALDRNGMYANNTVYFLPIDDLWILAVLNSPLMWSFLWREAQHGKDEALRMFGDFVRALPIPQGPPDIEEEAQQIVESLISKGRSDLDAVSNFSAWLQNEFGVQELGRKLAIPHLLPTNDFVAEVKRRRASGMDRLRPGELADLKKEHESLRAPLLARAQLGAVEERRLSRLVNQAFGLTPEEVELVARTAPPRMPPGLAD